MALHVTLRFLGEVDDAVASTVSAALAAPLDTPAFDVRWAGLGRFPVGGPPRVVWLGCDEGTSQWLVLHTEVAGRLREVAPAARERFHPHLTLARVKAPGPRSMPWAAALQECAPAPVRSRVTRVVLVQSRLGARARRILRCPRARARMIPILLGYLVGSLPRRLPARPAAARRRPAAGGQRQRRGHQRHRAPGAAPGTRDGAGHRQGRRSGARDARARGRRRWIESAGDAAVLGHMYPVWLGFRGGKGVATAAGALGGAGAAAAAMAALVFVVALCATRYVSLGSMVATAALPPIAFASGAATPVVAGGMLTAALIVSRHRANLSRVLAGTERRVGQRA